MYYICMYSSQDGDLMHSLFHHACKVMLPVVIDITSSFEAHISSESTHRFPLTIGLATNKLVRIMHFSLQMFSSKFNIA